MSKPLTEPRICQSPKCENPLDGKRVDAIYCSSACKTAAYHARKGITTKQEKQHGECQREECNNPIPTNARSDTKYCSNACRQKVYHKAHEQQEKEKREKVREKHRERKQQIEDRKVVDDYIKELMGE